MENQELDLLIKKTLAEKKAAAESHFEGQVRAKVDGIIATQNTIDSYKKALAKLQQELRALKLEHVDHSELFE